MRTQF
jgi:hypothetical protein